MAPNPKAHTPNEAAQTSQIDPAKAGGYELRHVHQHQSKKIKLVQFGVSPNGDILLNWDSSGGAGDKAKSASALDTAVMFFGNDGHVRDITPARLGKQNPGSQNIDTIVGVGFLNDGVIFGNVHHAHPEDPNTPKNDAPTHYEGFSYDTRIAEGTQSSHASYQCDGFLNTRFTGMIRSAKGNVMDALPMGETWNIGDDQRTLFFTAAGRTHFLTDLQGQPIKGNLRTCDTHWYAFNDTTIHGGGSDGASPRLDYNFDIAKLKTTPREGATTPNVFLGGVQNVFGQTGDNQWLAVQFADAYNDPNMHVFNSASIGLLNEKCEHKTIQVPHLFDGQMVNITGSDGDYLIGSISDNKRLVGFALPLNQSADDIAAFSNATFFKNVTPMCITGPNNIILADSMDKEGANFVTLTPGGGHFTPTPVPHFEKQSPLASISPTGNAKQPLPAAFHHAVTSAAVPALPGVYLDEGHADHSIPRIAKTGTGIAT